MSSNTEEKNLSPWTQEPRKADNKYGLTSKLSNTINNIGFGAFNHKGEINHKDILNSYSSKILEETWIQLSNFIKKNYESGRGTKIKGFGIFTFMDPEYNLEGTTNQYKRDLKLRRPVFIVSNEFLDFLKPGQFTKRGGLIYYTQKLNNKVNLVNFNYTELAFALNISKEECKNIITNIIKDMANDIINKQFKSRELPGLGIILIRGNIFGVKFNPEFNLETYKKVEKLNFTKNNIDLHMNVHKTDQAYADLLNAEKAINELNPKDSVITHLVNGADTWLKNNLDIDVIDYDNNIETHKNFNKIENYDRNKKWQGKKFFNTSSHNKLYETPKGLMRTNSTKIKNNKENNNNTSLSTNQDSRNNSGKMTLKSLNYPKEILEALVANKGQIIKEMKLYDKKNNGLISRFEIARSFYKANCHPALSMNNINDIIKIYANNTDYIDYYKLITSLIKEIKQILKGTSFCKYGFDDLSSTFNNKFKLGRIINDINNNKHLSVSVSNKNNRNENIFEEGYESKFNINEYNNMRIPIIEVEKEINTIKLIFGEVMNHKETYFKSADLDKFKDNNYPLNYNDFIQLLKVFNITYPRDKILKILKFMNIENPLNMTLNILNDKLNKCKISSYEMNSQDLELALKDILFSNRLNLKNDLFETNVKEISLKIFLKKTHNKTRYTDNILTELFYKMSNKNEILKYEDFISYYENPIYTNNNINNNNILNQRFYEQSCEKILNYSKKINKTPYQYFDYLLSYNYLRKENTMGIKDFILAILQEPYEPQFTEEQLEFIFNKMDLNKDGRLDRNEFKYAITKENNALLKMQDIIKNLKLTIDDLSYRLEIGKNPENQNLNFYQFKTKLKKMDCYYTNEFIEGLFKELVGSLDKTINCKYLLDNLNVYKNSTFIKSNNETFKVNYISNIQKSVDFHTLKSAFEKEDKNFSGKIPKSNFCKVINLFTKEFKDEDTMKFVRICGLTDTITYEVNYSDFLNMIYYNEKLDIFLLCVNEIKKLCDSFGKNIKKTLNYLNGNNNNTNWISIDKLLSYLKSKIETEEYLSNINNNKITKTIICKLDLDGDGKISFEDLRGILRRYDNTSFFKYENSEKGQNVNLYASDYLNDEQFKAIVREIKSTMKKKNITEVGLFKKLDEDNDGFINNYEFNKNIENIVEISPATKDRFFNYLDYYHNGMVDLETFLLRFKEFKSNEVIVNNNNNIENVILDKLSEFISKQSKKMNDTEIFSLIDKDSDGIVSLDDFKYFVIDSLGISKIEFNDYKLERVMQSISLSKNKNIGLGDIREFMNKALASGINSYYVDLKETFKETTNQNLFRGKKNTEWITQAIERLGMYITEKYDGTKKFFEKFADNKLNKFKFEHFIKFHENNFECFHGFNLTRDELLAIFTSLDSQKKNYLTLEDLQNKVELFDFYRKMHVDIKNFLNDNFPSEIDSFKFFLPTDLNRMNKPGGSGLMALEYPTKLKRGKSFNKTYTKGFYRPFDSSGIINSQASGILLKNSYKQKNDNILNNKKLLTYMTKKQFFDGINILFPQKYPTETILRYMQKYFNINKDNNAEQKITYSQYVFVYYGKACNDNDLLIGNLSNSNLDYSLNNISNKKKINISNKRQTKVSNTRTSITARCFSAFDELNLKNELGRIPYAHNLYPNEEEIIGPHPLTHMDHPLEYLAHQKLITPFDNDALEKVRRIIVSSPNQNYIDKMKQFLEEHKIMGGICNEFEFKNMLKSLYLGLTNVEIDDIIRRSGKTYNGKLNVNDFFKFVTSKDKNIIKAANNLSSTLSEIKQLLYKYYSNPKLAFTFIDSSQSNLMDFEKYRTIIAELYKREERPIPNFALLKDTYDYIDLRKDGLIDMVEWTNAFGNIKGKLDAIKPKNKNHKRQLKILRKWETSNDIINIYKDIARNRKLILQKIKDTAFGPNSTIIHEDNLIKVLKDIYPYFRLTNTQWKMIVEIGDKDTQGFINFDTFIKLVENCARREEMPRMK